ncbi:putative membrane protein [Fonticella tunisiensis]|uniref:Putative membrane protein n=1 Tax=Fonticella tunisiensis TaxID=1096341 RepID=A0A4R7KA62_9CLOT|nr:putative membrane protein [Fonticella tunisiensis]
MKYLRNILKGLAVGVATMIPGVSGGTMAVILGIYDDLIHSIGSFFEDWKKHTSLLFQVGLGGLAGILLFSKLLETALNNFPFAMRFLFIGVICGGLPVLFRKSAEGKRGKWDFLYLLAGFIIVLAMSAEPATAALVTSTGFLSIILLLIAGVIIAVALILPGISASFMLLALGLYDFTLKAINDRNIAFLIPIGLGVLIGTLATTRTIERVLRRYPGKTYMLITGFVTGSLIPVFPGIPQGFSILSSIFAFASGFALIRWISKKDID